MDWLDNCRLVNVRTAAKALGLVAHRDSLGACPGCGAEKRGRADKRGPIGVRLDNLGWRCFSCDLSGDALDLVALALDSRRAPELDSDGWERLRAWYADHGWCTAREDGPNAPQPQLPPLPEPVPERRIPVAEVKALWRACVRPTEGTREAEWLQGHGYDLASVRKAACVLSLPEEINWPAWWPSSFRRWPLVAVLYDGAGIPAGLHGRAIDAAPRNKTTLPFGRDQGFSFSGLWMMSRAAIAMTREGHPADRVLVVEGITDFLRAVTAAPPDLPIIGGISGSFKRIDEVCAPSSPRFILATDGDDTGDKYAERARMRLPGRVYRARPPDESDLDEVVRCGGDLDCFMNLAFEMPKPEQERHCQNGTGTARPPNGDAWSSSGDHQSGDRSEDRDPGLQPSDWPELQKLPPRTPPVPHLDPALLPEPLRAWLIDEAERASLPLELLASPAIVTLSSVVGRSIGIRPQRRDDWTVVPNLWGAIVASPGSKKSHALGVGLAPLLPLTDEAHREYESCRIENEAHCQAVEGEIKAAMKKTPIDESTLARLKLDLEQSKDVERRFWTSDATAEKLAALLADNTRGMLVRRDELTGWLADQDKPGREGTRAFFIEGWEGDRPFHVDRIARGSTMVEALCLSIVGTIQPGPLHGLVADAAGGGRGADGLLQRFQILVWPDDLVQRSVSSYPVSP
jgi:Protein of unknown function (DUF3987)/Toprim-like